jgi:serine/threonine protein kinase
VKIADGGMGEVYKAVRQSDGVTVAFKRLKADRAGPDDIKRFRREVRLQSQLKHPNIVPILAMNLTVAPPWFVMPLASGNLRDRLGAGMPPNEAVAIFLKLADALEHAHSEGVIHRDLKPENVLFIDGEPRIADFGIGRLVARDTTTLTLPNALLGTPAYASPEQFRDAATADERADIYALGKVFYELLTGHFPYPTMTLSQVPARYRYIVGRCVAEEPRDRFESVTELKRELELLTTQETTLEPPNEAARRLLQEYVSGSQHALTELDRFLHRSLDDEALLRDFVPKLPLPVLEAFVNQKAEGFKRILYRFDECVAGPLPFSYTDAVANFYGQCFALVDDLDLKRVILTRLLLMGFSHDRYHVRAILVRILEAMTDTSEIMLARQVLRDHPDATLWSATSIQRASVASAIKDAIPIQGAGQTEH